MQETSIKVCVKIELKDYLALARELRNKWEIPINIVFIITAILAVFLGQKLAAIYLILLIIGKRIWNKISDKKLFESNKLGQKEIMFNFTENDIEITGIDGNINSCVKWSELHGARQNNDAFFLMTSKAAAFIIPKRLLDIESISMLNNLIKDKLGNDVFKKTSYIKLIFIITIGFILAILSVAVFKFIINDLF